MAYFHLNTAKTISKTTPLFPNYLFAQFDLNQNHPLVKWGKGVDKIIGFGKYPTPLAAVDCKLITEIF
jgi:hypothetical protein